MQRCLPLTPEACLALACLLLHLPSLQAQAAGDPPAGSDKTADGSPEDAPADTADTGGPPAGLAPHEIPLAAFFRTEQARNLQLSPEGTHISMLFPAPEGGDLLALADTDGGDIRAIRSPGPVRYADYAWISERYLVFHVGQVGEQMLGLGTVNIETGENRVLVGQGEAGIIDPLPDSKVAFIGYARINNQLGSLISRVEADSGVRSEFIYGPDGRLIDGYTDALDDVRLLSVWPPAGTAPSWYYRTTPVESWEPLDLPWGEAEPVGLHVDGERVFVVARPDPAERNALYAWKPGTPPGEAEKVYQHHQYDLDAKIHLASGDHRLLGVDLQGTTDQTAWLDPELAAAEASLRRATGARAGHITALARDARRLVYRVIDDRAPGTWYYFDREANTLRKIVEPAPWLKGLPLAPTRTFTVEREAGGELRGLMTTPAGYKSGETPLVLLFPEAVGEGPRWGWNPVAQWLASRGIAVMEIWIPGMAGAGVARPVDPADTFAAVGEALAWARRNQFSRPDRTVLMGRFFGAWQALQSLARHPDAAAGAIALAPFLEWAPFRDGPVYPGKTRQLKALATWYGPHLMESAAGFDLDVAPDAFTGKRLFFGRDLGGGDVHPPVTARWLDAVAGQEVDLTVYQPAETDGPLDLQRGIEAFLAAFLPVRHSADDLPVDDEEARAAAEADNE
ncbi:MAG: alpha/beta hydrolase family protein [Opitutales bacterium]